MLHGKLQIAKKIYISYRAILKRDRAHKHSHGNHIAVRVQTSVSVFRLDAVY